MERTSGSVLKANDVNVQGSVHLDIGRPTRTPAPGGTISACTPQAAIVEKNADFAVIEITCNCGTKTRIRCDYNS